jgi:hypothetical protein
MRVAIIAGWMAVGLSAGCGGAPEERDLPLEPSSAQAQPLGGPSCTVECWDGPNAGATSSIGASSYSECETYAMSFCGAAQGAAGGFWWRGQAYAW